MAAARRRRRASYRRPPPDGLRQRGLEFSLELALRVGPDDLLDGLSVLEQDQRRDREDLVGRGALRVLVGVELDDAQVVALARDLFEDRGNDAARAAPGR